ncbi:hypothetical protein GPECTOR_1g570 [Gonium pectorale]|uniref:Rhodanese domain-containing protein n=1 Tax=Gonium pectorale TaxID=33097 RepID=A0A150H3L1_GONPE|nr:hypothetical protein GPECTOR_1g570 [Gonium pectorale]|eukprot:KXZ56633.1 hypothetical protein GPECTOR_1g570 [Gonium pectorale]
MEHQPSWVDYRAFSDSDEPDAAQGPSTSLSPSLAALLPDLMPGRGQQPSTSGVFSNAVPATALPSAYSVEAGFKELPPHELHERLATGQVSLLLDVRSRAEFESGSIAGALNLPLDPQLSDAVRAGSLDEYRQRPVAVVCASGSRSAQATVRLSKVYGFKNVVNVTGGMQAWVREGLPVHVMAQRPATGGCGCGGGGGSGGCKSKPAA